MEKGRLNLAKSGGGMLQFMAEALGADETAASIADVNKRITGKETAVGENPNRLLNNFEGAVSSIVSQAPGLAVGIFAGATVPLVLMGAQSFGTEYSDGRKAGLGLADATGRAAAFGVAEVIGEKVGMPSFLKTWKAAMAGAPTEELIPLLAKHILREIPGEQLTTLLQFSTDKFTTAGLTPEAGLAQYLQQAQDTLVQTVMQAGMMSGAAIGVSKLAQRDGSNSSTGAPSRPEMAWEPHQCWSFNLLRLRRLVNLFPLRADDESAADQDESADHVPVRQVRHHRCRGCDVVRNDPKQPQDEECQHQWCNPPR